MRTRIDKILKDPSFNYKGIFKVIEPNKDNHKIAYFIDEEQTNNRPNNS